MHRDAKLFAAGAMLICLLCACDRSHSHPTAATSEVKDGGVGDAASALRSDAQPEPPPPPPDDNVAPPSSDELTSRARHLLEAIGKDDASLAVDIVFPRDGWLSLRDAKDPGKDWDRRVSSPFRAAIHRLSRNRDLGSAEFESIELGRPTLQLATRRHGWKQPVWVVHGSRLTLVVGGHAKSLSIREMTAWRGAWYVTRLR